MQFFRGNRQETCWARKDVSPEVHEGEVLGLIARNGPGKTTRLTILSRITRPTEGWAEIRGRVGSLLGVGTGFHPELTGRENAYLSGVILGMSRIAPGPSHSVHPQRRAGYQIGGNSL